MKIALENEPSAKIVLRRKAPFRRTFGESVFTADLSSLGGLAEPTIEEVNLTPSEEADLSRDPEVHAIASPMPLKLVEPLASTASTSATSSATSWGVQAVKADISQYSGKDITIAVLDTGINPSHDAFAGVNLVQENFTQDPNGDDTHGHGTHCAGTIFGRDVNGLRIGVAPGVTKALIGKVLGQGGGSSATLVNAINWAYRNGANVISMSLGIDFPGFVDYLINNRGLPIPAATSIALEEYRANVNLFSSLSQLLEQSDAFSQAAIIVAASGNESDRPNYVVAVAPPAAGNGVISVGAIGHNSIGSLGVARFSNINCNLCAPGVDVTSAWIGGANALNTISGTSMATPHVAGCAALWAEQQNQLTGNLTSGNLSAKVLGSSTFIQGQSYKDIGIGLVQAP